MSRSGSGAVFSASNMKIGDTATGSVTITNTGSLAAVYSLAGSTTGSAPLAGQLHLGDLQGQRPAGGLEDLRRHASPRLGSVALGTFAATTGSHVYYFHIDLPTTGTDAGDNVFQGLTSTATFTWSATQA